MTAARPKLAGAAVATAIALAILVALGLWQVQRLHWKQDLLARIDAAEHAPPQPLAGTPALFTRVTASGILRDQAGVYGAEVKDGQLGAQLVEVLDRAGAPPLLVVLGWVSTQGGLPRAVSGPVTVTGYVRLPEYGNWLSAADDVAGRRFYTLDPGVIGPALGAANAAPFMLVALTPVAASGPVPADALPRPVNNHLQYALTWFGLAGSLLGVFVAWAVRARSPVLHPADC